ncbi:DUF2914 domain-containing protein [Marinobacter salinisoli]|uniref:DUF2914 domain-containing protein n=1 Tax=Marinobacter salinisoli TaxID=2769486 RepID=A0ABX7MNQ0_9GAMM|nr:DUF2914 domain-containing protein [Marinobacter salinisoli]QSP93895.1 DUF2914 domain-containing protein [Marinobacter salinisoli]
MKDTQPQAHDYSILDRPGQLPEPEEPQEMVVYYWGRIFFALTILAILASVIAWGVLRFTATDETTVTEAQSPEVKTEALKPSEQPDGPVFIDELEPTAAGEAPSSTTISSPETFAPATAAMDIELPDTAPPKESAAPASHDAGSVNAAPTNAQAVEPEPENEPTSPIQIFSDNLTRAQLSSGLEEKEPIDQLTATIDMEADGLIRVFLFTEVRQMINKKHFHDWYLQDERVARVEITPFVDPMRASSAKFIDRHMLGDWRVEIVTEEGERLAVGQFTVQ